MNILSYFLESPCLWQNFVADGAISLWAKLLAESHFVPCLLFRAVNHFFLAHKNILSHFVELKEM